MLAVLIVPSLMLIGCAKNEIIRPITDKDIFFVGDNVCMTPEYMEEVLQVKLELDNG